MERLNFAGSRLKNADVLFTLKFQFFYAITILLNACVLITWILPTVNTFALEFFNLFVIIYELVAMYEYKARNADIPTKYHILINMSYLYNLAVNLVFFLVLLINMMVMFDYSGIFDALIISSIALLVGQLMTLKITKYTFPAISIYYIVCVALPFVFFTIIPTPATIFPLDNTSNQIILAMVAMILALTTILLAYKRRDKNLRYFVIPQKKILSGLCVFLIPLALFGVSWLLFSVGISNLLVTCVFMFGLITIYYITYEIAEESVSLVQFLSHIFTIICFFVLLG